MQLAHQFGNQTALLIISDPPASGAARIRLEVAFKTNFNSAHEHSVIPPRGDTRLNDLRNALKTAGFITNGNLELGATYTHPKFTDATELKNELEKIARTHGFVNPDTLSSEVASVAPTAKATVDKNAFTPSARIVGLAVTPMEEMQVFDETSLDGLMTSGTGAPRTAVSGAGAARIVPDTYTLTYDSALPPAEVVIRATSPGGNKPATTVFMLNLNAGEKNPSADKTEKMRALRKRFWETVTQQFVIVEQKPANATDETRSSANTTYQHFKDPEAIKRAAVNLLTKTLHFAAKTELSEAEVASVPPPP